MRKHQHKTNNGVLGAPEGWDQKELPCDALPVTHCVWDGHAAVLSFWKPSVEEMEQLLAGGSVVLWVSGRTMPPVALSVEPQ